MGHIQFDHTKPYEDWFWEKNNIKLVKGWVKDIRSDDKKIILDGAEDMFYDSLIIATGSVSNKFGWPGENAEGVRGLYNVQDLEYIEQHTKNVDRAVVVGGGLIGIELAEMLHSRSIEVTFLVREKNFWDIILPEREAKIINQEILGHHIDLRLETELKEIITDAQGKVSGAITNKEETLDCQFVGLTVGVSPNVKWLKGSGLEINRGIVVNEYLETNLPDVYAIGDCAEHKNPMPGRRPVEQVWYTGRMMGETVAQTIAGRQTAYRPGIWFNSAKFFNIEYQTYGSVKPRLDTGQEQFYWQAEDGKKCIRVVFDQQSKSVIGAHAMGIRMRHEVWDNWLKTQRKVGYVMENLEKANFDPEFFKKYEFSIRESFNQEFKHIAIENQKPSFLKKLFA